MKSVDQVAVVVRDLDEAMRRYAGELGIAPWNVYTFSPDWVDDMTFRGRAQPYSMRVAIAEIAAMQYGDGGYASFETDRALGCILEAIEPAKALPDPERTYSA